MGQLDDAIREHLDLKRRRGADPTEVERAEYEALGPVRRGRDPEAAAGVPDELAAFDEPPEAGWDEEFDDVEQFPPPPRFAPTEPPPPEDHAMAERPGVRPPLEDESPPGRAPYAGESVRPAERPREDHPREDHLAADRYTVPPPSPAPATPSPSPPRAGETVEYNVERALAGEGQPKVEDPLEETPEFLQDTPEHERLWFEQRPPRDFDFDG